MHLVNRLSFCCQSFKMETLLFFTRWRHFLSFGL